MDGKDALKADLSEIEAARGAEPTLGERLDASDAQLADIEQKVDVDIPAQLNDKVQNFKITNSWVNSNFLNGGIEGWTNSASRLEVSVVEGYLTLTGTAVGARLEQIVPFNKIYYYVIRMKTFNANCGIGAGGTIHAPHSGSGLWENISAVRNNAGSYPAIVVSTGSTAQIEKACLINLTDTFGAGNEPTKEAMDDLMKVVPNGWWDGDLLPTQKQIVNLLLKLEREKANKLQGAWSPITLLNGWTGEAYYMQDDFGTHHIKASLSMGVSSTHTPILTLPTAIAPIDNTLIISGGRTGTVYSKFYFSKTPSKLQLRLGAGVTDASYAFHYSWRV